jgi:hypothetical protein
VKYLTSGIIEENPEYGQIKKAAVLPVALCD